MRDSALKDWTTRAASLISNLILAFAEGLTLVVVFQAIRLLRSDSRQQSSLFTSFLARLGSANTSLDRGQQFLLLLLIAIVLHVLVSCCALINGISASWFIARRKGRNMPYLHHYLLHLSFACASRFRVGHLISIVSRAPQAIQVQIMESELIFGNFILICVYLASLSYLSPWLSLFAVCIALAVGVLHRLLQPKIRATAEKKVAINRRISTGIAEDLQMLRLLHSFAAQPIAERRTQSDSRDLEKRSTRLALLMSMLTPVSDLMPVVAAAVIGDFSWFLYGGKNEQLVPTLMTFVLIIQRLNLRLARIGHSFSRITKNNASLKELDLLINRSGKVFRRKGGILLPGPYQSIEFDSVCLRYPELNSFALSKLRLSFQIGTKVALVGESGSGKSSIVDLLVGLYNPTSGVIRVDGVNLEDLDLDDWQRRLGVVSQDVLLINGTIAENIAFATPDATEDDVINAARAADSESFILGLPDHYATRVGERGFRLSGGQRQRISLARALLRHPQLLILDEATSSLDSLSEARILASLKQASSNTTLLMLAHRLSTICHADKIFVLDHGRVAEQGRHNDLLSQGGLYADLWRRQSQESTY
jgi:subfamily B ATP-binding cassette protein MsbA